jgi:hypothetical protein
MINTQDWITCQGCGKRGYRNRKTAKKVEARMPTKQLGVYECQEYPGLFHVGHLPTAIIRGDRGRASLVR